MTRRLVSIHKFIIAIPLAVFGLSACDNEDEVEGDTDAEAAVEGAEFRHGKGGRHKAWFAELDSDGNGSLSATEVQGHRIAEKFAAIDADGDGALTHDEMRAFKREHHGKGKRGRGKHMQAMFEKLDADGNGELSNTEVQEHPRLAEHFAKADADGSGSVTKDELMAFKKARHDRKGGEAEAAEPR